MSERRTVIIGEEALSAALDMLDMFYSSLVKRQSRKNSELESERNFYCGMLHMASFLVSDGLSNGSTVSMSSDGKHFIAENMACHCLSEKSSDSIAELMNRMEFSSASELADYVEYLERVQEDHQILKAKIANLNRLAGTMY